MSQNNLNQAEVAVEKYVFDFISTCDTQALETIYQHMECVKIEELPTDTLHMKYKVTEADPDHSLKPGDELLANDVYDADKYLDMTIDDLQMLYELICDIKNERPKYQLN